MSYQFTHFAHGAFDAYLAFVRRLRPEAGPTREDLRHRWRVFDNPWDGYFLLAHTDEELAATLTLSARCLRTPTGQTLPCYELSHGWTHPRHRRRGLFFSLGARAADLVFSGSFARLIIGAPNPAAVPNWRRHRYLFTRPDGSQLVLLPRPLTIAKRRLVGGGEPVPLHPQPTAEWAELDFSEYTRRTAGLPRMNQADEVYLRWRFRDSPDGYRYFSASGGSLLCALRLTRLGDLPVVVVSEWFADGKGGPRTPPGLVLSLLPRLAARFFSGHAGVYIQVQVPPWPARLPQMALYRYLPHRPQPLCFLFKDGATPAEEALMNELRRVFQLSDCDVG
ncbi:MAG: hypothetical protein RMK29_13005 [Myxococcales bacterium]|nr:hypothetical protein [Myxococcota bacterium]MDW8282624.1 hypothetical protein [Myxococcales bacterium]